MKRSHVANMLVLSLFLMYAVSPLFHSPHGFSCAGEDVTGPAFSPRLRVLVLELLYSGFFSETDAVTCDNFSGGIILKQKRAIPRVRESGSSPGASPLAESVDGQIRQLAEASFLNATRGLLLIPPDTFFACSGLSPPSFGL